MKLKFTYIFLLLLFFSSGSNAQKADKQQSKISSLPNIVYILADDMGIGDVSGFNGNAKLKTPHIDLLIDQGMTFTDAHTAASVCTPTRYGLMTGRYPWRTQLKSRVLDGYSKPMVDSNIDTAPKLLQRNGYQTAMIGKWHLGWNWALTTDASELKLDTTVPFKYDKTVPIANLVDYSKPFSGGPTDCGFDYFYGINASLDFPPYSYCENNKVINIPKETLKKPTGSDYIETKQMMMRIGDKAPDFDPNEVLLTLTNKTVDYINQANQEKPFFLYVALTSPHTPVLPRQSFEGTSKCGRYGDFIQEMDWSVGQIIMALKNKGLLDNTLLVFTADNGASKASFPLEFEKQYDHNPSGNVRGRKNSLLEGGHRVPFVVHWPEVIKNPSKNNRTINLNDFYATCQNLVGENNPNQGVDSYSILSLLKGEDQYNRRVSIYSNFAGLLAIRKGDFKLTMNRNPKRYGLYNLKADLMELNNLFDDSKYEDVRLDLEQELENIITKGRSTDGEPLLNDGDLIWKNFKWIKH